MASCNLCSQTFPTLVAYFDHFTYHSSVLGGALCPMDSCSMVLKNYATFRSHLFRHHRKQQYEPELGGACLVCPVMSCGRQESSRTKFVSHIASHLDTGTSAVVCPFPACVSTLKSARSFRTHVCRYHQEARDTLHWSHVENVDESEAEPVPEIAQSSVSNLGTESRVDQEPRTASHTDRKLLTDNFALFLLKLEALRHVPAKTVQYIVKEVQNLHNLSQQIVLKEIGKIVSGDVLHSIQPLLKGDAVDTAATMSLRTSHCRHKYYKENFHFVHPVEIALGLNKENTTSVYHYVPIEGLIHFLMAEAPSKRQDVSDDCFSDYVSCRTFRHTAENEVQVILYQDEFETANPLGSAKGKFKLLGVYMTLGNLPLHCRLRVESMQLVMLCRQKDVKEFGLFAALQPLVNDLVHLERRGTLISGVNYTVRLKFIVGDNLGSHAVGGFTQNFSSSAYFCRFCLVTRADFDEQPHVVGNRRTPENYNKSIECLVEDSVEPSDHGVVGDSPFHSLQHFHVCSCGLPPCIGHDLFEGVVRHDLALYIMYFVKKKAWFTYEFLNTRILTMKYTAHDLRNKPAKVPLQGVKIAGHAVQNLTLLRLLPVYLGAKVVDTEDSVWQLVLLLMQIVDFLMAPRITPAQVSYLKVLIEEYIDYRSFLFPTHKLRPKHHFMLHYSELIQQFGPLCHVWTLRFESKHQYFKSCIRSVGNFKNITKTLAEQHQLCQAFLAARGLFHTPMELIDMSHHEQSELQSKIPEQVFEGVVLLKKASLEGFTYTLQDYVLVSGTRFDVVFGFVVAILKENCGQIVLLIRCTPAQFLPGHFLYILQNPTEETMRLSPSDLLDRTPYQPYSFNGNSVIRLNFSFPEKL